MTQETLEEPRDYLVEAVRIVRGETLILPQKEHLLALWNLLPETPEPPQPCDVCEARKCGPMGCQCGCHEEERLPHERTSTEECRRSRLEPT